MTTEGIQTSRTNKDHASSKDSKEGKIYKNEIMHDSMISLQLITFENFFLFFNLREML